MKLPLLGFSKFQSNFSCINHHNYYIRIVIYDWDHIACFLLKEKTNFLNWKIHLANC